MNALHELRHKGWIALLAGAATGLAWPPIGLWPFALVGPGVLVICLLEADFRSRFLASTVFFTSAWSVAFFWNALHPNSITAVSSIIALFCMVVLQSVLITAFSASIRNQNPKTASLYGLLGVAVWDWIMLHGPVAMPGTMLGLSLSESFIATNWVPYAGSFALTLMVLMINAGWVAVVYRFKRSVWAFIGLWLILLVPHFLPDKILNNQDALAVTLIQPGVSPEVWADVESSTKPDLLFDLLQNARSANPQSELFVLPETALPISSTGTLNTTLRTWTDTLKSHVLSGAILRDSTGSFYNAAAGSGPDEPTTIYRKRRLVPFVEAVPFGKWLPFRDAFRLDSGGVSAYQNGDERTIMSLSGVSVGVLICFESFFPHDGVRLRQAGAQVIGVLTQDGWWQSQTARRQHEAYTRLLVLATGLPAFQASVDGESLVWDAFGNVISRSRTNDRTFVTTDIPLQSRQTVYSRLGESPSNVFLSLLIMLYLASSIYLYRIS